MPRIPRLISSTGVYHIVIRGLDHQMIFEEQKDFEKYLSILAEYKEECHFDLIAYALMSNHIHLILHINEFPLETIFKKLNTRYAIWFNMKYQRCGHLQQERFFSEPIESESYLINAIRYIHQNPLKAGLEASIGTAYPWTSYYAYLLNNSELVDINFIDNIISRESFISFHTVPVEGNFPDIDNIKRRIPDDVAQEIMFEISRCKDASEFQKLSIHDRNEYLIVLKSKKLSVRQLNRLTGTPTGVIRRILA